ncbi:MAG: TonB-dependent receptor [Gammaproteobacteria bacterium]|nr:TonB-dependent receptor [Gammaproteobacteria bacterium]
MRPLFAFVLLIFSVGAFPQTLEEIVVTAKKRTQSIQDVGMSVGVMLDEDIDQALQGGIDVLGLANRLPSLHIESSNGRLAPRFYVRGIGNVDFDLNASQPISFIYDDVILENPAAKSFPLFDIERLELLRGPQGTLFGRNTTGGILKFDSKKPTSQSSSEFRVSLGARNHLRADVAYNRPLTDSDANFRIALMANTMGDWIDNRTPGREVSDALGGFEDYAFRLLFEFQPTGATDVLLNLHGRMLDGTPTIFYANAIRPGSNEFVDGFGRDKVSLDAFDQHFQESRQLGLFATIKHKLEDISLISITGIHSVLRQISRGDVDGGYGSVFGGIFPSGPGPGIPFDAQTADALDDHLQITQEFRLEGKFGLRHWLVGFYAFREDLEIETFNFDTVFAPHTQNGYVNQVQETNAYALFGTIDLVSGTDWTVSSGLRLSADSKKFTAFRTQSPLSFLGIGGIGPISVNPSDTVVTWDVSAETEVLPNVNGYARVAKGHRAPSIQGRLLFQDTVSVGDTESSLSLEAGAKAMLLENRLRLHASVYNYRVDDFQITKIGGAANVNELINVAKLLGSGAEIEFDWLVNESWSVTGGMSVNLTELSDSDLSVNGCGSANLLSGCTVTDPQLPSGEYLIDGNSLYNSPERIMNLSVRYVKPTNIGNIELATDWAIRSSLRFTLYESLEYKDDGAVEGGARIGIEFTNTRHRVSFYVRNILDDESMIGSIDFNNLTSMLNAPRTWGIEYRHASRKE